MNVDQKKTTEKTLKEYIETEGIFYHASLAPGVKFDQKVAQAVGEAVRKNLPRMMTAPGGQFDIKLSDIF
jgi:hypothetical protein